MPYKLTDSEIVKALDICSKSTNGCSHSKYTCEDCYLNGQPMCSSVLLQDAIDLINRLQAENEGLKKLNEMFTDIGKMYSEIKAEAYKECIGKAKEIMRKYCGEITEDDLDNLLKEMVGEDK